ncbi:hypothetical protein KRR39_09535 [Nocardioides panacis]|uniref:Uncharacterized protein n=1 Tax=Nocardioides panacis TaxID=2849501 RepID=A0A975T1K8_9ACTN|nr:hypothetical protein [Nocardioides panacis]QWZ09940.1 hypothetical protein KRR39_09535 [Nocardioides panacis]
MGVRIRTIARLVVLAALVAGAGILVGRATVDTHDAHQRGYRAGLYDGYFDGLPVGEAQGRREGRALQAGSSLPAPDRHVATDAFSAGYAAGADDVFAGYDGGWALSTPYVVTVRRGLGGITYRIASRAPVESGVSYFLCPTGHRLCQRPRP